MLLRRRCLPIASYFAAWLTLTLSQAFCFVQSTEEFLGTSPRMTTWFLLHTLQVAVAHCIFFPACSFFDAALATQY